MTLTTMDNTILLLSAPWLGVQDASTLLCVCKDWHAALESSSSAWKQILTNTYGQAMVDQLEASFDAQSGIKNHFLHVAQSLGRGVDPAPTPYRQPSLHPRDIFFVVELYRMVEENGKERHLTLGSISVQGAMCMFRGDGIQVPEGTMTLQGSNPFHSGTPGETKSEEDRKDFLRKYFYKEPEPEPPRRRRRIACMTAGRPRRYAYNVGPLKYALQDMAGLDADECLKARVTMFQNQNMKSVCVLDSPITVDHWYHRTEGSSEHTGLTAHSSISFAADEAGANALRMLNQGGHCGAAVQICLQVYPALPDPETTEGYTWLKDMRLARREDFYQMLYKESQHKNELAQIPHFTFEFRELTLKMKSEFRQESFRSLDEEFSQESFRSPDEMAVVVEGLSWQ